MAIKFRLADEERKKAEKILSVINASGEASKNDVAREEELERVRNEFDNEIRRHGEADTEKHTFTLGSLRGTPIYDSVSKSIDNARKLQKEREERNSQIRDRLITQRATENQVDRFSQYNSAKRNEILSEAEELKRARDEGNMLPTASNRTTKISSNNSQAQSVAELAQNLINDVNIRTQTDWTPEKMKSRTAQKSQQIAYVQTLINKGVYSKEVGNLVLKYMEENPISKKMTQEDLEAFNEKVSSWINQNANKIDNSQDFNTLANSMKPKTAEQKERTGLFKGSNAYKDDKNAWDNIVSTAQTAGATVGDVGLNFVKGLANVAEGVGDLTTYGLAQVQDWLGYKEAAERNRRFAKKDALGNWMQPAVDWADQNSVVGDFGDTVVQGAGYMSGLWAGAGAGESLGGVIGGTEKALKIGSKAGELGTMITTSFGNGMTDAYNKGATDKQAWVAGATSALVETMSEEMFGYFGNVDIKLVNKIAGKMSSGMGKTLARLGMSGVGEGIEELISYAGNYATNSIIQNTIDKDKNIDLAGDWNWEEIGEEMLSAFLTASLTGAAQTTMGVNDLKRSGMSTNEAISQYATNLDIIGIQEDIKDLQDKLKKETNAEKQNKINQEINLKQLQLETIENRKNQQTQQEQLPAINEENTMSEKLKAQAKQEIQNSKMSDADKKVAMQALNEVDTLTETDMDSIRQMIDEANETAKLPTEGNFKYQPERKRTYMQYKNDTGTYDSTVVDEVLDTVPTNRNGRRTVNQWKSAANEIGKRISNMSNEDIERIAYKSWFDVQPSKSITQYDNVKKTNVGFSKLDSDTWVNEIYRGVNEGRENNVAAQATEVTPVENSQVANMENLRNGVTTEDNLTSSAQKHNLKYNDVSVESIQQVMDKAGIKSRFDIVDDFMNKDGTVNEKIGSQWRLTKNQDGTVTREIIFNPYASEKTIVQEMAVHEMLHDIVAKNTDTSDNLYKSVQKYLEKDAEYIEQKENLREQYKDVYDENVDKFITEEAIAKTLQTKFGTQEEIDRLVKYEPTVARRFYDWVVDKLNKITGGKIEKLYWEDVRNKFERAYSQEGNYAKNSGDNTKFDIVYNEDGTFNRVKITDNIFENNNGKSITKTIEDYLIDHIGEYADIIESGQRVYLGEDLPSEYAFSKYSQNLSTSKKLAKGRAVSGIKEIIETATNREYSNKKKPKHALDAKYGFYKYDTKFSFEQNGKEQIYSGTVLIRNDADGKKYLYDILNIKKIGSNLLPVASNSQVSSAKIGSSNNLPINSIPSSNENVNTTKYSIQESGNNTDNQGRTLSKEQQKYFKDSKIRDEDGNLLTVYHGTPNGDFYTFDDNLIGSTNDTGWYGRGFYFTQNKGEAGYYGSDIKETYLNIKNPFNFKDEMQSFDGQTSGDVYYDYGAFMLNLNKKFKDIAKNNTEYYYEYANNPEDPSELVRKEVSLSDLANKIEEIYNNKDFKIIEVEDNGKTKYEYHFEKPIYGGNYSTLEQAQKQRLSEVVDYIKENIYHNLDMHIPETYMQSFGKEFTQELKNKGYDGVIQSSNGDEYVAFYPNQIKAVDNTNPTTDPDIRYSNNANFDEYIANRVGKEGTRTSLGDLKAPTEKKVNIAPTPSETQVAERPRKSNNSNNDINELLMTDDRQKFRKHYDSIMKSQNTTDEAKAISKELMKSDTYVPESNNKQLERADTRIRMSGADSELSSLMSRAMTGGNIKADDIAVGERLIQYYSKMGDKAKLQEAIQATAMAGTTAGQTVQAMSLLNHQTPEGQAVWLQRSVEKINNDLKQRRGPNADQFDLTPEMIEKITNSNNAEELQNNLNEVYDELGQQVSKTTLEKIDSWRYFAMLSNARTHIRNIVGNVAMGKVQRVKNKVAGVIEGAVANFNPEMERTHTIAIASKEVKEFAKNDIANVADRLELNDNKYNPKTRLENSMRTFKHDAFENTLGKLFEFNNKALEAEDAWGLKAAYKKSLAEYMTANKLSPNTITDKQLAKARNYAIEQAKEATFHQASAIASAINQFSKKNGLTKFATDAIVPFKKTPINVAKAGMEYSPVGLTKSIIYDTVQLRKGNISVNKYIDNISKGLTGTGITLLGYALASAGILKASGSDDKDKEKYDEDRGKQTYSIQIGDNTYSLDWLAPTGIPLFIGAETYEIMQQEKETKSSSTDDEEVYSKAVKSAENILDAFTNAMNPMTEMSMLSGVASALKSYDGDNSKMLANLGVNATKSYVNQFIPTALSQVARTTDQYERSTTSTKKGVLPKAIDSTKNYMISKIPGLRQTLPTKTDIWGNDVKQNENVLMRGLENAVFPWTRKGLASNNVDKELNNLYESTGESSILPDNINKDLTIDKQKYVMTSEEYAKYKKQYGQDSYNMLNSLVSSSQYKKMTDKQKQKAIEEVYDYAKEQIKLDYAKNNKLSIEESNLSKTIKELKKSKASINDYFDYIVSSKDLKKKSEKIEKLTSSNCSKKTKQIIYENNLLEANDEKYQIIKDSGLDIDSYLKYKIASSNGEFAADIKNPNIEKGSNNTITGSGSKKAYNYIMNMDGATYMQKIILYGLSYSPKETDKQAIANYIVNMEGKTYEEIKEMLKKFSWITIYNDGSYDI